MRKKLTFEKCEPRLMLTTTIYLDFGIGLGFGSIDTTVGEYRDFLNDGGTILAEEQFTGTDMTQEDEFFGPMGEQSQRAIEEGFALELIPLSFDFNGSGGTDELDLVEMSQRVQEIAQAALLPFDVDVVVVDQALIGGPSRSTDLSDARTLLTSDRGAVSGTEEDAYVFVMDGRLSLEPGEAATEPFLDTLWDIPLGAAADRDLNVREQTPGAVINVNETDEAVIAYARQILVGAGGRHDDLVDVAQGVVTIDGNTSEEIQANRDLFQEILVNELAYTSVHEAFHTFSFHHSALDGFEPGIIQGDAVQGDIILVGGNDPTPEARANRLLVTRFDTSLEDTIGDPENHYDEAVRILGLRNSDGDSLWDYDYVTGTGANDTITIEGIQGSSNVEITVEPFDDFGNSLGPQVTHTVSVGQSEGTIFLDSSLGDDTINITGDFDPSFDIWIRGGAGDDVVISNFDSTAVPVRFDGESGADELTILSDSQPPVEFYGGGGEDVFHGSPTQEAIYDAKGDDHYHLDGGGVIDVVFEELGTGDVDKIYFAEANQIVKFVIGEQVGSYIGSANEVLTVDDTFLASLSLDDLLGEPLADLIGDANLDGKTNETDFLIYNENYFQTGTTRLTADFNGDGVTDGSDFNIWNNSPDKEITSEVQTVIALAAAGAGVGGPLSVPEESFDFHDDGEIKLGGTYGSGSTSDLKAYVESIGTRLGDSDLDGHVDAYDWGIVNEYYNQSGTTWSQGDFNGDGVTNFYDMVIWTINKTDDSGVNGDITNNSAVNVDDIDAMFEGLNILANTSNPVYVSWLNSMYDLNNDGAIDQLDADFLVENILGTAYGDANLDGIVNSTDLNTVVLNLYTSVDSWADGDFNGDGIVDDDDLDLLYLNWGFGT